MNVATGIAEGLASVASSMAKTAVRATTSASDAWAGQGGAASAREEFLVTINSVTIFAVGERAEKTDAPPMEPIIALTLLNRDFSERTCERAVGALVLGQPLIFGNNSHKVTASLTADTLCVEVWGRKMTGDIFFARACLPLVELASMEGGSVVRPPALPRPARAPPPPPMPRPLTPRHPPFLMHAPPPPPPLNRGGRR